MSDYLPPELLHALDATGLPLALNFIVDIFKPLIQLLQAYLNILYDFVGSWGWSIILLTLSVRVVIFPLTWKQIKSQRAMQALQPKIKELQRKFKGDRKRLQQETMRLYQEYSINPLASCFPLLLQLPIFISLYYAIRGSPGDDLPALFPADATFLWFTLSEPDPYYILLIVYVVSQLASTELMLTPETQSQQKWIMRAMPFVFIIILRNFPSGLFLYWITTNLWTVGQAGIIRYLGKKRPMKLEPVDPSKRKRSRFMEAMAAAQDDKDPKRGGGSRSRGSGQRSSSGKKKRRPAQGGRTAAATAGAAGAAGARAGKKRSSASSGEGKPKKRRAAASAGAGEKSRDSSTTRPKKRKPASDGAPRKKKAGAEKRRAGGAEAQPGSKKKRKQSGQKKSGSGRGVQTTRTGKRPVKPKPPKPSTESQS